MRANRPRNSRGDHDRTKLEQPMSNTTEYLEAFKLQAPAWFAKATFVREYFEFFRTFFKRENLEKAEWPDVQKIGSHLHCFQSMAMAQRNALGRPNHPIEHYRKSFTDLEPRKGRVARCPENWFSPALLSEHGHGTKERLGQTKSPD